MFTDTFSGIRPHDVPAFIAAQLAVAVVATLVFRCLPAGSPDAAEDAAAEQQRAAT